MDNALTLLRFPCRHLTDDDNNNNGGRFEREGSRQVIHRRKISLVIVTNELKKAKVIH